MRIEGPSGGTPGGLMGGKAPSSHTHPGTQLSSSRSHTSHIALKTHQLLEQATDIDVEIEPDAERDTEPDCEPESEYDVEYDVE
jgi:hypothetical protein